MLVRITDTHHHSQVRIIILYAWLFVCMYICVQHTCIVYRGQKRASDSPQDWSYRQLCADMWVLGIEPEPSGRADRALTHLAISLAPGVL